MRGVLIAIAAASGGCDRVLGLQAPPDALVIEGPACLVDPAFEKIGMIPAARYMLDETAVSWAEARDGCAARGDAHLVVVSHLGAEWRTVTVLSRLASEHWIGISKVNGILAAVTTESIGMAQPPWAAGQPSGEDCVALTPAGMLDDVACDRRLPAVCECEPPVDCTSNGPRDYLLLDDPVTWQAAHAACTAIDMRLVVITSSQQLDQIEAKLADETFWIDAHDEVDEGTWTTRDGCRPYLRWGVDNSNDPEPNRGRSENCAAMFQLTTGGMSLIDAPCDGALRPLCERP